MRHAIGVTAALLPAVLACGGSADGYKVEELGPAVTRGPLTVTPILVQEREIEPFDRLEVEEGYLRVPVRHDAPGPDSVTIHFLRYPSTAAEPGPPIVYLAGGPGGTGSWSSTGDRFDLFLAMRAFGDVIALDQRGTFGTDPYMVCPGSWDYPLDQPTTVEGIEAATRGFLEACYRHWADSVDVQAFNTRENANDLDDLREALGADQLVLWGISYGAHLALAYVREYPDRVAAAMLHGVEGPDHTYKLPADIDRVLLRVDSAMKADPALSAVLPDFVGALTDLLAQLERAPLRVEIAHPESGEPVTVVLGANDLRRAVYGELGESDDIAELPARALPVLNGEYAEWAEGVARGRSGNRELVMSLAMDCASGATAERMALIDGQAETAIMGDVGNLSLRADCATWPAEDLGDAFRGPVTVDAPVLFVSGSLDPRTPASNAEEVMAWFPNAHHLVVVGGSHDDDLLIVSPEIQRVMEMFLRGETVLPARVVLPALRFAIEE